VKEAAYILYLEEKLNGPKRDEITGEWRKLHNEELSDLYSTLSNGEE
jgi:hypothetical protein